MSGVATNAPASRPPLPSKPRAPNRSRKQREREVPDVDWEASLQHFAAAVSDDLDELHLKFLQQDEVTFAVWKRLWADARMSAAFHVEFWESSPTNTHKTVLQQALDALVFCIEEKDGEFESSMDIAALVGRVFALYCAYSVQLGEPKHKIDVDPRSWKALLTINCVMCGVGKTLHPTAAREVRAMMLRLVVEENAFLRCLKGFGPSVRVKEQPVKSRDDGAGSGRSLSLAGDVAGENSDPVQHNTVELLRSLDGRYQQLISRARSTETSVAGAGLGGRRGNTALSSKLLSTQEAGGDAEELARALTSYIEYKANEEARRNDRVARAAAAREYESRTRLEEPSSERDDCSNILDLSDRGSALSAPPSPVVPTAVSAGFGANMRRDSGDSEDLLAELETELHAGVSSDHVGAAALSESLNKQTSSFSEISEADSDALADLERELEQSADLVPSQAKTKMLPARRKRGREPPAAGIVPRKSARVAASTEVYPPNFMNDSASPIPKRSSAPSGFTRSWTATSTADSDGLADIQAELNAVTPPTDASGVAIQNIMPPSRLSALSAVVSEADSDALGDLERELNATTATLEPATQPPIASTNGKRRAVTSSKPTTRPARSNMGKQRSNAAATSAVPSPVHQTAQTTPRGISRQQDAPQESTRIGSVLSDTESDGLAELVAELGTAIAAQLNPSAQRRQKSPAKTTKKSRSATRKRTPKVVASRTMGSKAPTRSPLPATGLRRSSRLSSVASDAESDGLEDLLAELESTPKTQPVNHKKPRVRAVTTKNTAKPKAKPKPSRTPRAPRKKQAPLKRPAAEQSAIVSQAAPPLNLPSSRRSIRSSSIALASESDGLAELEAELQAGL